MLVCYFFLLPVSIIASNAPNEYWKRTPNGKTGLRILEELPSSAIMVKMTKHWNNEVYTTKLLLKRKFKLPSNSNHCHYIGHVQGAKNVTIAALTGCIGKQDVHTNIRTIMVSKAWSSWSETLIWKLNGDIEEIKNNNTEIMDVIKNDEQKNEVFDMGVLKSINVSELHSNILTVLCKHYNFLSRSKIYLILISLANINDLIKDNNNDQLNDWFDPAVGHVNDLGAGVEIMDIPIPTETFDKKHCAMDLKGNIAGLIPSKLTFEITASYDDNYLLSYNNSQYLAEDAILRCITFAQTYFMDKSLGTQIDLKLLGNIKHWANERMVPDKVPHIPSLDHYLELLRSSNLDVPDHVTNVLFTAHGWVARNHPGTDLVELESAISGVATGGVCATNFASRVIMERHEDINVDYKTLLHELGHLIGMRHNQDWNEYEGIPEDYCIISKSSKVQSILRTSEYTAKPYAWTICNRCDLLRRYQEIKVSEALPDCLD